MPVDNPIVGSTYRMTGVVKTLCCTARVTAEGKAGQLSIGENVTVVKQTSKNRLLIKPENQGYHTVKRSTFRMNVEEIS